MYESNKYYLICWLDDNETTVTDGWNLNAIKHRDMKEGSCSVSVIREATGEDIKTYGIS